MLGLQAGKHNSKKQGLGYAFVHHAVDDCTRLAYSEQLADERKETAAAFWTRARDDSIRVRSRELSRRITR